MEVVATHTDVPLSLQRKNFDLVCSLLPNLWEKRKYYRLICKNRDNSQIHVVVISRKQSFLIMTIGQYRTSEKTLSPSPEFFICLDFSNEIACVIALDSDDVFTSPQDIIPTNIDLEFNYWIESVLAASYQIYPLKTTC